MPLPLPLPFLRLSARSWGCAVAEAPRVPPSRPGRGTALPAARLGRSQQRGAKDHDELGVHRPLVLGGGLDERGVHVGGQAGHEVHGVLLLAGHGVEGTRHCCGIASVVLY
jgi:hypothetical protein